MMSNVKYEIDHKFISELSREIYTAEQLREMIPYNYKGGYGRLFYLIQLAMTCSPDAELEDHFMNIPDNLLTTHHFGYEPPALCYSLAAIRTMPVVGNGSRRFIDYLICLSRDMRSLYQDPIDWILYTPRAFRIFEKYANQYIANSNRLPIEQGYIYIIQTGDFIKIGKSIDPNRRLNEISPNSPYDCEILEVYPSYFMSRAEKALHRKFAKFREKNEWFQLSTEIQTWMETDAERYIELSFLAELHDELMTLPEMRLVEIFDHIDSSFDPHDHGWKAVENFQTVMKNCY
jgi:hypothetical protein